jgi:poly(A) polymerase Pap1
MVARICQLYPMACGATILAKFFNLMHKWNWPRPVMLKDHELGDYGLRVWNPAVRTPLLLMEELAHTSRYPTEMLDTSCPSSHPPFLPCARRTL